jgi:hypothetical protein
MRGRCFFEKCIAIFLSIGELNRRRGYGGVDVRAAEVFENPSGGTRGV